MGREGKGGQEIVRSMGEEWEGWIRNSKTMGREGWTRNSKIMGRNGKGG